MTEDQKASFHALVAAQIRANASTLRPFLSRYGAQEAVDKLLNASPGGTINGKEYPQGDLYKLSIKVADVVMQHCGLSKTITLKKTG